ncbi:MAG: DUF6351 family protein [Gammaproteobacteria bacterium]|jgi:hypothetical protein
MNQAKRKYFYIGGTLVIVPLIVISILTVNSYFTLPRIYGPGIYGQSAEQYNFWIGETGPTGPVFSGPQQSPFICLTTGSGLGQPVIDQSQHQGTAVFPEFFGLPLTMLPPAGYSKNCSVITRVDYFYFNKEDQRFLPLSDPASPPETVELISTNKASIPFVVRVERGTINRFIYSIAMLAPYAESLQSPQTLNNQAWNGKLVYKFQGGVGIGHYQGRVSLHKGQALHYESLKRGYAVAYSTGTRTSTHYNLQLAEETAFMVKEHFKAIYGEPQFTIGLGASGGGIQQYVMGQNRPGLIDGAIAQASYPDMITQTINVADCELLERYFDHEYMADSNSQWADWLNRTLVEGTVANNTAVVEKWQRSPAPNPGASECVAGWRGTIPAVFNPQWTHPEYFQALELFRFPDDIVNNIKWTHWNDLGNIYPRDEQGFAPNSWDNVGVQYGLVALKQGKLDKQSFLDINACAGGWKHPQNMITGQYPWDRDGSKENYDPWDKTNMNLSENCKTGPPAPRTRGNLAAMQIAYESGHVFTGNIDIPVLDIRWYLEPVLDMHHSVASFASRARIQAAKGHHDHHIIWMARCSDMDEVTLDWSCDYDPTGDALDVMGQWLNNLHKNVSSDVASAKPSRAADSCMDGQGTVIYSGDDAWDGVLHQNEAGRCTREFPVYSTSRMQAGDDIRGSRFKCRLKPVSQALRDGTYGKVVFNEAQLKRLNEIFADGVCDYSKPDMGLPTNSPQ